MGECLDELAREGVRFSGQFPVLHVYKDGQKKHQVSVPKTVRTLSAVRLLEEI